MTIDRHSAAYLAGKDDGYACKRENRVPPADIVATWGQAHAEREAYHPNAVDTVRWWYVCGFAEACQNTGPICKDYPEGCWRCDSGDRPLDAGCYKFTEGK